VKPVAVGVSGRIGSGKTTLAEALAHRLGCSHASFGEYVRSVAKDRGARGDDRRVLQDLGDELISAGWESFCSAVLEDAGYSGGSIVVDGIRHLEAIEALKRAVDPVPWRLVAVNVEPGRRGQRLHDRGVNAAGVSEADAHPNESEVDAVLKRADYEVMGTLTADAGAKEVCRQLERDLGV
jgi:dephospho-CoA kinase